MDRSQARCFSKTGACNAIQTQDPGPVRDMLRLSSLGNGNTRQTSSKSRFSRSAKALISARLLSMNASSLSRNRPSLSALCSGSWRPVIHASLNRSQSPSAVAERLRNRLNSSYIGAKACTSKGEKNKVPSKVEHCHSTMKHVWCNRASSSLHPRPHCRRNPPIHLLRHHHHRRRQEMALYRVHQDWR